MTEQRSIQALLKEGEPKRIVISSHSNPDGDAIGSSLAVYHYVLSLGHQALVILPNDMPENFGWLEGYEQICIFEQKRDYSIAQIKQADIIFCLDYSALQRADDVGAHIADNKTAFVYMIDHHLNPQAFYQACLWRSSASSTCELVHEFLAELQGLDKLNLPGLYALYTGLLTDTGGFRHAVSASVFRVASDLVARGVDANLASDLVFNSHSYRSFELLAFCLRERLLMYRELNTAFITISRRDYERWNIQKGDLEGIANMVLRIRPLRCAVLLTERKNEIRLSMRSKGDFSVQEICSNYFQGGGHRNASGGTSKTSLEETCQELLDILYKNYREQLHAPLPPVFASES